MQAILLAGGKGTRLRPYTTILPKPLMPIGNYPIMEILIKQLIKAGVNEFIIATGYLSHLLETYFGNGDKWGVKIRYSHEDKPLGTAGPLGLIDNLENDFFVMNGDLLTNIDFKDLYNTHVKERNALTVSVYQKDVYIDLGVLELDDAGIIIDYIEKPTLHYNVSMGIYVMNKQLIERLPSGEYYDLPDLVKSMINTEKRLGTYKFKGEWLDVGRHDDYEKAITLFEEDENAFLG